MKKHFVLIYIAIFFAFIPQVGAYTPTLGKIKKIYSNVVYARDFDAIPDDGKDDAKPLRDVIDAVKKNGGNARIVLEKGAYDFKTFDAGAFVTIRDADKIMIDGNGATIVRHLQKTNFFVLKSKNTTFANLKFETSELPFAGAVVTNVSTSPEKYFDCKVIKPHKVKDGATPKGIISYDPENNSMGGDSKFRVDLYQMRTPLKIKQLTEDTMRVPIDCKYGSMPRVGDTVLVRYEIYGPSAISIHSSKDTRVYNTSIISHSGMGVYGMDSENILIDRLIVKPKSKEYFMSATADATHFNYCRGRIDILNSVFEKMGDDATNVHQMYWIVDEVINPQKIAIHWGREGKKFFPREHLPRVGDKIVLGTNDNWLRMETFSKVVSVSPDNKNKVAILELETPLPDFVKKGMPMGNYSANPVLNIKNCKVYGNRARGFLIKVSKANVENCVFEKTSLAAILMENDANFWYEGCRTENVKIKNCVFKNCNFWGFGGREGLSILDAAEFTKGMPNKGAVNVKMRIENCVFENCGTDPISVKQTQYPVIKNNKIF